MEKYLKMMCVAIAAAFVMPNMAMANPTETEADLGETVYLEDLAYEDELLDENYAESDVDLLQRRGRRPPHRGPGFCTAPANVRIGRCNMTARTFLPLRIVPPGGTVYYTDNRRGVNASATLRCVRGQMVTVSQNTRACRGWGRGRPGRPGRGW